ncbi:MAG: hypothetical protein ACE5SW_12425 [Nitrososphaeraceae archaeon]
MESLNDNKVDNKNINFLSTFAKNVLNSDKSIRWIGITDHNGNIINGIVREGLPLLLTREENNEFAKNSITRHKARIKFEKKWEKSILKPVYLLSSSVHPALKLMPPPPSLGITCQTPVSGVQKHSCPSGQAISA